MSLFDNIKPTDKSNEQMEIVRRAGEKLYLKIIAAVPECRERDLALTRLEEASMWANKGIVFHQEKPIADIAERLLRPKGSPPP